MQFNLDEYFGPVPGSEQEKNIVIFARRHWVSFLGEIIISILLVILPIIAFIVAYIFIPGIFHGILLNFLVIFGSVYYLLMISFIFNAWISYYYDVYILTYDEIFDINQSGFFERKISQLSLLRVQDVSSDIKGFFPTLFAYGNVLVETAGEQVESFLLKAVPNPQEFSAKVLEMHDRLIEREGRQSQVADAEGTIKPIGPMGRAVPCQPVNKEEPLPPEPKGIEYPPKPSGQSPLGSAATMSSQQEPYEQEKEDDNENENHESDSVESSGDISKDDLDKGGEVKF